MGVLGWVLVVGATLLALQGLRRRDQEVPRGSGDPPSIRATVIAPVKGFDEGLRENLAALASQDRDFELIVVCREEADLDPAAVPAGARVVFAGPPQEGTAEKISNLLAAVRAADPRSEVFVFADSDGRVGPRWLVSLVAAVQEPGVGAATGYRWHLPARPDFPSLLRSVWNAVIAGSLHAGPSATFCWGGAMAVRRSTWEKLDIPAWWVGTLSDDYRLAQAVRHAGLRIAFVPEALVAAEDGTGLGELLSWTARQMRITRFYNAKLWKMALFAHVVYCGSMVAAVWLWSWLAWGLLAVQLGIGYWQAWGRVAYAARWMPEHREWFRRWHAAHILLTPVGTWLWLWACVAAWAKNSIEWRGYTYRMHTPAIPQQRYHEPHDAAAGSVRDRPVGGR
ncbi:MAG: glycosyltransferase [Bryobacterales bacterium]|nr:glycosyltransferase [Bryobacterales bacterium]